MLRLSLLLSISTLIVTQVSACSFTYAGAGSYCCGGAPAVQSCVYQLNQNPGGTFDYLSGTFMTGALTSMCQGYWRVYVGVNNGTITSESLTGLSYNFGNTLLTSITYIKFVCSVFVNYPLEFPNYSSYFPVSTPTITGLSPSTISAGDSITISGTYMKGNPGLSGVDGAKINGVAGSFVSGTPTTIVIQTPVLLPGTYSVVTTVSGSSYLSVPGTLTYATPVISSAPGQRFSWSTFPVSGGTLYIYGTAYMGTMRSLYTLTNGVTTITAFSLSNNVLGFIIPSGVLNTVSVYDLKYQTSFTVSTGIPVNYGQELTSFEITEKINILFSGPWAGYVSFPWTFSRKGGVVTAMANTSPITGTYVSSSSISSSTDPFPIYYRPTNTERCYVHVTVGGVAVEVHIDVNPAGYFRINSDPSGSPFSATPAAYSTGCTWIVPY